jgi:hypothetical protein
MSWDIRGSWAPRRTERVGCAALLGGGFAGVRVIFGSGEDLAERRRCAGSTGQWDQERGYGPPAGAWLAGSDELGGLEQIRQTHPVQHLGAEPVEHGE